MQSVHTIDYARLVSDAYTRRVFDIGEASSSARAIVQDLGGRATLAIPGTNNIACWLADLDCDTVTTGLGRVHKGFRIAASEIEVDVRGLWPSVLVGHSEGAALALILAGLMCLAKRPPSAVYAFEPPQLCCDDTLRHILAGAGVDTRCYRNGEDIVPRVPRLLQDWRHPADLIQFGKPSLPVWNVEDHMLAAVIASLNLRPDL